MTISLFWREWCDLALNKRRFASNLAVSGDTGALDGFGPWIQPMPKAAPSKITTSRSEIHATRHFGAERTALLPSNYDFF
jgi:hypothetical protein